MRPANPITYYGRPLFKIILAWIAIVGLPFVLGGEDFRSSYWLWFAVLTPHWVLISYLVWLAFDMRTNAFSSPPVRSVRIEEGVLIVGHRDWLGVSVAVLVFKQEGEFERLLCAGNVINVQQNGLVQIAISTSGLDDNEVRQVKEKISDGENHTLIIKPGRGQEA